MKQFQGCLSQDVLPGGIAENTPSKTTVSGAHCGTNPRLLLMLCVKVHRTDSPDRPLPSRFRRLLLKYLEQNLAE